jgi:[acyl-carrier-protein] S-malonyltransferase
MKLAVVFPGQGSPTVGMGRDWCEQYADSRAIFEAADRALGFGLSGLCFEGPEERLKLTEITQPAILATSIAIWNAARELVPAPSCFAGHSLGEYTALVAAGALGFEDALRIVHQRGRLMQTAVPLGEGAMAAVIGLDAERVTEINHAVMSELNLPLEIANHNSLEQIVVSGAVAAVAKAMPLYSEAGARRVVELAVSAPFHSSLMAPAANGLKPMLDGASWSAVSTPVIANLTASPYPDDHAQYPLLLHAQMFNPVRWTETVQYMAAQGVTHLLEVGPGKVLRMLTPKITKDINAANIEFPGQLDEVLGWLAREAEA